MTGNNQNIGIKNIIFDLGGVILNIDYPKTEQAFIQLGLTNFASLYTPTHASGLFKEFEIGKVSPEQFIAELTTQVPGASGQDIVDAWNAMLLDFPKERITFLKSLQSRFRMFLLSNTNAIHFDAFQKIFVKDIGDNGTLDAYFEKAYYSHLLGLRKPGKEIYEHVINENHLVPEETIFIDDSKANVEAAQSVNLKGLHLPSSLTIQDLLSDY